MVAYRCLRLHFGLRPSPCLLMLVLYKMLIMDGHRDSRVSDLQKEIYNNIYVDNGGLTSNETTDLEWKYVTLQKVFKEYKFTLQQYATNDSNLQSTIDCETGVTTGENIKVLGHRWNRVDDTLSPGKIQLDKDANTLRQCLSSVNAVYDLLGIYTPVLLRARLFVQSLQSDPKINWDTELTHSKKMNGRIYRSKPMKHRS